MKILLERTVEVETFECEADVGVSRDLPELLAVASLADNLKRPINSRDITEQLLDNLPFGKQVLSYAVTSGLLEREGNAARLTPTARTMLKENAVLMSQRRMWRFHLVDDPLVRYPLLHVEPLDADPGARDKKSQHSYNPPDLLTKMKRELLRSVVDEKRFQLHDLYGRGKEGRRGKLHLSLQWEPGKEPKVWLHGDLPNVKRESGEPGPMVLPLPRCLEELSYEDVWFDLVSNTIGVGKDDLEKMRDHVGELVWPTDMEDKSEAACLSFKTDLPVRKGVPISKIGGFNRTEIKGIPLVPDSNPAAEKWAKWLLWQRVSTEKTYLLQHDITRLKREVMEKFPLFKDKIALPDAKELLRDAAQRLREDPRDQAARFLLAPADLGLWS